MGFFDDPANQPSAEDQVKAAASAAGVPVGETDLANLAGKNPEDVGKFVNDLTAQYQQRASNAPNNGADPDYGSIMTGGVKSGNFSGYQSPDSIAPWQGKYTNPTEQEARNTPGYQFQFDEGVRALDRAGASKGTLLGGGQMKALTQYGQGLADTNYAATDARAFRNYADTKDSFLTNEQNRYSSQRANLGDQYSMLSGDRNYGLAAQGQAFGQDLANRQFGQSQQAQDFNIYNTTDSNYYNRLFGLANIGNPGAPNYAQYGANGSDLFTGGANANAAGIVGSSNAQNQGISDALSNALSIYFNSQRAK